jgi:hypothetical protein
MHARERPGGRHGSRRRLSSRRARITAAAVALGVIATTAVVVTEVWPDDSSMPVGDLPGWRQVFTEDFDQDVPLGSFPGDVYGARWGGYEGIQDTAEQGTYSNRRVVSVRDGVLDMYLRTEGDTPLVAAPTPHVDGQWGGQLYGRYSVRFRADPVDGYKTAWLLWPDSNEWAEGEIDFPEGELDGEMYAANLKVGHPGVFDLKTDGLASYQSWHIATTEWTPDGVTFYLDGEKVGFSDVSPSTPMHWVLQTETAFDKPPVSSAGHVEVDWVTVYEMD